MGVGSPFDFQGYHLTVAKTLGLNHVVTVEIRFSVSLPWYLAASSILALTWEVGDHVNPPK